MRKFIVSLFRFIVVLIEGGCFLTELLLIVAMILSGFNNQWGTLIAILYIFSIAPTLVCWILNMITDFDYYTSFWGRFFTLVFSPVLLPYRCVVHAKETFSRGSSKKSYSQGAYSSSPSTSQGNSQSSQTAQKSNPNMEKIIKKAVYAEANRLRLDSTLSAKCVSYDCWILFYVVHVNVTLEFHDNAGPISDYSVSSICSEVERDISNAIQSAINQNYTGDVNWQSSIEIKRKISSSQYYF